jgi:hypothetical protein
MKMNPKSFRPKLLKVLSNRSQIGENIVLRRGVTFTCNKEGYQLMGLTHPSAGVTRGRFDESRFRPESYQTNFKQIFDVISSKIYRHNVPACQ